MSLRPSSMLAAPAFWIALSAFSPAPSAVDAALARWDMPMARMLAAKMPLGPDRSYVEGVIAERENRLDEAETLLSRPLPALDDRRSSRAEPALEALVDVYRRKGDRQSEYALIDRWLRTHDAKAIGAETIADLRNELGTSKVLRGVSQRAPTGATTVSLPTRFNKLGTRNVDLTVHGVKMSWMIDTGANYSLVSESMARRMGLKVRDTSYQVGGSTGHVVATRLTVIDDLPVGHIILHDVVALVVPDEALLMRAPQATYQVEAALGYPALAQLGRFRIDPDGTFTIDRSAPLLRSGARLYMDQMKPVVEVEVAGTKRYFDVDTGATSTTLYASYAAQYRDRAASWAKKQIVTAGMGGRIASTAAIEPEFTADAGGRTVTERNVSVALEGDRAAPILGNIGQPLLSANGSYTFDFRSMRLSFGPTDPTDRVVPLG